MESIDRIIEFIAGRDPKFPSQIRGAAADEVARLEAAVCRALPAVYRRFLERMGHSMGWLEIGNGQFQIEAQIRYHEQAVLQDPPDYLMIGRCSGDACYDYYLWETRLAEDGETIRRVVSFPPPPSQNFEAFARTRIRRIAGSLPQLLGDAALSTFCNHRLTYHRQVEGIGPDGTPRLPGLDELLRRHGLPPIWFSNDWRRSYERADLLVTALESPATGRLIVDVRAENQPGLDAIYPEVRDYVKSSSPASRLDTPRLQG
ncbi:MAG: hypothetical protein ABSG03_36535 [Bryobacteraceae bacterium]